MSATSCATRGRGCGARARGLCADAGVGAGRAGRQADRDRQCLRHVRRAAMSRRCSRPPTRRSAGVRGRAGALFRYSARGLRGRRRRRMASPARRGGLSHAAARRRSSGRSTPRRGTATAAFTVARVEPGEMAEGRIQVLTHHTEDAVWQRRWLAHPNGALGLASLAIAVADVDEAARALCALHAAAGGADTGRTGGAARPRTRSIW